MSAELSGVFCKKVKKLYIYKQNYYMGNAKAIKNIGIKEFEQLFKEYYTGLCFFALRYTEDKEAAEEVVQDVFYTLWEKREKITIKTSVKSYLHIAVRNKCLQKINHLKVKQKYLKAVNEQDKISTIRPDDNLIYNESIEIFNEALSKLPEKCRTIFKMSRFEGLKYKEIAFELSISVKTVEAYITKALKHFRRYFPEYA
ncbi:MAG: RNA polymerase sigma-70 factor [Bacteroidales bacterium]|nr:RNA polymerase sigma-70 factor [Bacteroidales bacterium]